MFGSADKIQVLAFDLVHHIVHFVEAHHARNHVAVNHIRRNHVRETLIYHEIAGIGKHGGMQTGNIARKIIKALPGSAARGIHVDAVQSFQNIQMIRHFEIGHDGLAEPFEFHVLRIVFTDRHVVGDDIRNRHHRFFQRLVRVLVFLFYLRKACGVGGYLRFHLFRFVFFAFFHQHAHLLGKGIARGAEGIPLGD